MARRKKRVPSWLAWGAGCCGMAAAFTGCASSQPAGVARMWETPPGVPAAAPSAAVPGAPDLASAPIAAGAPGAKKWSERANLPEKMLAAFGGKRPSQGDPFLADYAREAARPQASAAGSIAVPQGSDTGEAIALPGGHDLKSVPGLTDALGRPQSSENPLDIVSADHQPGEKALQGHPGDTQLTRLQAAMDLDRRQLEKNRSEVQADEGMRDRVGRLMKQARSDMEEGRIAAAFKTAQQAESLASEVGLNFDDQNEQPTILVQMLREKLQSDVKDPTELPPEKSVENSSEGGAPDLLASRLDASGKPLLDGPAVLANDEGAAPRGRNPFESDDAGAATTDVELLPAPPDSAEGDALVTDRRQLDERRSSEPVQIATVVGPSTPIGRGPASASEALPPQPAELDARYAAIEPTTPFWPGRTSAEHDSGVIDARPSVPATLGMPELNVPEDDAEDEESPTSTRNVSWQDAPEAIFRINIKKLPKPLLAAMFIAGVWAMGFGVVKASQIVRSMLRR